MHKYYGIIIFALLGIACDHHSNNDLAVENDLALYKNLAMAEAGLDFPPSQNHLETCQRVKDIPCLRTFKSFNEGKSKLLQMPRSDALELTLKQIAESCVVDVPAETELACMGTVMALYFFSKETEDIKIRQFLLQLPPSTLENVFDRIASLSLCWLENRFDKTAWRSWLKSELKDTGIRSRAIYRLEKPAPQTDPLHQFPYYLDGK